MGKGSQVSRGRVIRRCVRGNRSSGLEAFIRRSSDLHAQLQKTRFEVVKDLSCLMEDSISNNPNLMNQMDKLLHAASEVELLNNDLPIGNDH